MIKKYFTQTVTFLKELVVRLWDATDYIEVPSKFEWTALIEFKDMVKYKPVETLLALAAVTGVILFAGVRFAIITFYLASAFVVISVLSLYKLLTFWKKSQ
jgi:hypothetical protein